MKQKTGEEFRVRLPDRVVANLRKDARQRGVTAQARLIDILTKLYRAQGKLPGEKPRSPDERLNNGG